MKIMLKRILAALLTALLLAAMPAAMAQPGPTPAPNRCTGNPDGSHYWGKWKTKREATCEKEGKKERKCRYCSQTEKKSIKKTDHKWGDWTVTVEATDRSMGQRERTCTVCGTTKKADFYPEGTLKRGDKGDAVKALQNALNAKGYDCGKADGGFGKKTEKAVKAFEPTIGITGDGIAWPAVIAALNGTAVTLPEEIVPETGITTYDLTRDFEKVTITFNRPDGSESIEVKKGKPTYFALPGRVNGTPVDWVVLESGDPSVCGNIIYTQGMSFSADTVIGYKAQSLTLTLMFRGNVYARYHVEAGKTIDFISEDASPSAVIDDLYVEWYDTPTYDAKTSKPIDKCPPLKEDTTYYGIVMGYASWRVLTRDEYVYSDRLSTTPDALLPAGTRVCVISSEQSTANFYTILYEDNGVVKRGYLINAEYEEAERMIYLDANGGTVEPEIIPFTSDIDSFPTPTTESDINNKFVRWEQVDGKDVYDVNRVYRAIWEPEYTFEVYYDEPSEWNKRGYVTSYLYNNLIGSYPNNTVMNFDLPKVFVTTKRLPMHLEVTGWVIRGIKRPGEGFKKVCILYKPGEKLTGSIYLQPILTEGYLFTITYDMGPFAPRRSTMVKSWETDYVIPDPEPVDGYEFTDWKITKYQSPGSARARANVEPFTPGQKITGDITLQAQYIQTKGYTITFDAGEGNTMMGRTTQTETLMTTPKGTLKNLLTAKGSDSKMNFEGWYTADGERVNTDTVFTKDTTVYASWSSNPTVSFIKNKK